MPAEQLTLFASLDFPADRTALTVGEIAAKLGFTERHIFNEIDAGELAVFEGKGAKRHRRSLRVPVESYRAYVLKRLSGPMDVRMQFLADLPATVAGDLFERLASLMPKPELRARLRRLHALAA